MKNGDGEERSSKSELPIYRQRVERYCSCSSRPPDSDLIHLKCLRRSPDSSGRPVQAPKLPKGDSEAARLKEEVKELRLALQKKTEELEASQETVAELTEKLKKFTLSSTSREGLPDPGKRSLAIRENYDAILQATRTATMKTHAQLAARVCVLRKTKSQAGHKMYHTTINCGAITKHMQAEMSRGSERKVPATDTHVRSLRMKYVTWLTVGEAMERGYGACTQAACCPRIG